MRRDKVYGIYTNQTVKSCPSDKKSLRWERRKVKKHQVGYGNLEDGIPRIGYDWKFHKVLSKVHKFDYPRWSPTRFTPTRRVKIVFREDLPNYKYEYQFESIDKLCCKWE
ncbi:unnamed protein product [Blepharisma stoltei]|uniref:Uncharacterized protein n=1 Tax=Blepharisma stoltei TaxID=1481888 RepID=A0AAU9K9J6_9CILI|nr:unnamed protein product [Blepharisma stoltei]